MSLTLNSRIKLNNGIEVPYIGLGTYAMRGNTVQKAVEAALDAGYRLIDTAEAYGNEKEIGESVRESKIPREEIFITTKLANDDHGYNQALKAFDGSLKRLKLDYVDLYLIHWPSERKREETWKAFETLYQKGVCRAIGVSNYTVKHLNELFKYASVIPAVNQVEFNPFIYQVELLDLCRNSKIQLEGYTPLARLKKNGKDIKDISEKYGKSAAQILIRWALQHNIVVIPKSSHEERIKENIDVFNFEISDGDMDILNSMNENFRVSPDPHYIK